MNPKRYVLIVAVFSFILSILFFIYLFQKETKPRALPVLGDVPRFALVGAQGKPFDSETLKGKVWIIDFMFTTCAGICPMMTKNMAQLERSFKMVDSVRLVSVTVNPENDTPQQLKEYAKKFNADLSNWFFLTGTREEITQLSVNTFKLGSIEEPVFHSGKFVLIDRQMRIRGYYEGTDMLELSQLFKDIATLVKEKE